LSEACRSTSPGEAITGSRSSCNDGDYSADLDLISKAAKASGAEIRAWRLMPNPVHFIMTPGRKDGLWATFAAAHRR
jgi:REP element-mobilizing transposase RayT